MTCLADIDSRLKRKVSRDIRRKNYNVVRKRAAAIGIVVLTDERRSWFVQNIATCFSIF
jgi:hypothetical protein